MAACLVCGNENDLKICQTCIDASLSPDELMKMDHEIFKLPLGEQVARIDTELEADPENAQLHYWKGIIYEQAGNIQEALGSFDQAANLGLDTAWIKKGNHQFELGQPEAVGSLKKGLELKPTFSGAIMVGNSCLNSNDYPGAIEAFSKALEIQEGNIEVIELLSDCYVKTEDWDNAIEFMKKGLELDGENLDKYLTLGGIYLQTEKLDEALELYNSALEKDLKDSKIPINIADIHIKKNELEPAIESYEKAIEIDPEVKLDKQGAQLIGLFKEKVQLTNFGVEEEQEISQELEALFSESEQGFNNGSPGDALSKLKTIPAIEGKAKELFATKVKELDGDLEIMSARELDRTEVDNLVSKANTAVEEEGLANASELVKQAREKIDHILIPVLRDEAGDVISMGWKYINKIHSLEGDPGENGKKMEEAESLFGEEKFTEVIELSPVVEELATAWEELLKQKNDEEMEKCTTLEEEVSGLFKQAEELEVHEQFVEGQQSVSGELDASKGFYEEGNLEVSLKSFKAIWPKLEVLKHDISSILTIHHINGLRAELADLKETGADTEELEKEFQEIRGPLEEGDLEKAFELCSRCSEGIKEQRQGYLDGKLKELKEHVEKVVASLEKEEVDITELQKLMEEADAQEDTKDTVAGYEEVHSKGEEMLKEHLKNKATTALGGLKETFVRLQGMCLILDPGKEKVAEAVKAINGEEYEQAMEFIDEANQICFDLENDHYKAIAEKAKEETEAIIEKLKAQELDNEDLLKELEEANGKFADGEFQESTEIFERVKAGSDVIIDNKKGETAEELERLNGYVSGLSEKGVEIVKLEEIMGELKGSYEEENFKAFFERAPEVEKLGAELDEEHTMKTTEAILENISNVRDECDPVIKEMVEDFELSEEEAAGELDEIVKNSKLLFVAKEYDGIPPLLNDIREKAEGLNSRLEELKLGKNAQEVFDKMKESLEKAKEEGVEAPTPEDHLTASEGMMNEKNFQAVIDREKEYYELLEAARVFHVKNQVEEGMKTAKENITALAVLEQDITQFQDDLAGVSQTFEQGDYDSALEKLEQLNDQTSSTRSGFYYDQSSEILNGVTALLTQYGDEGMDVGPFQEKFDPLKHKLDETAAEDLVATEPLYREVSEHGLPLKEELENAYQEFMKEQARQKAEGCLAQMTKSKDELAEEGIDTTGVDGYIQETQTLYDQGAFQQVVEKNETFPQVLEDARKFHMKKKAEDSVNETKQVLTEHAQLGLDIASLQVMFTQAQPMFKEEQYQDVIELMDKLKGEVVKDQTKYYCDFIEGEFKGMAEELEEAGAGGMDTAEIDGKYKGFVSEFEAVNKEELEPIKLFYDEKLEPIKRLKEELSQAKAEFEKQKVRQAADEAIKTMEEELAAVDQNIDLDKAQQHLEESKGMLEGEDVQAIPERVEIFRKILDVAVKKKLKADLVERMKASRASVAELEDAGGNGDEFNSKIDELKELLKEKDYDPIGPALDELDGNVQKAKGENYLQKAAEAIDAIEKKVQENKDELEEPQSYLDNLSNMKSAGQGMDPMGLEQVKGYYDMVITNLPEQEKAIEDAIQAKKDSLEAEAKAKEEEEKAKEEEERAKAEEEKTKTEAEAAEKNSQSKADVLSRIKETNERLKVLKEKGLDVNPLYKDMMEIQPLVADEKFDDANSKLDAINSQADELEKETKQMETEEELSTLKEEAERTAEDDTEASGDLMSRIKRLRQGLLSGDEEGESTHEVGSVAKEIIEKGKADEKKDEPKKSPEEKKELLSKEVKIQGQDAASMLDRFKQETIKKQAAMELENLREKMNQARAKGADVSEVETGINEIEEKLTQGESQTAMDMAIKVNKKLSDLNPDKDDPDSLSETIKRLEYHIEKAPAILKLETAHELLEKAKKALAEDNKREAANYLSDTKKELKRVGDTVNEIKVKIKESQELIKEGKEKGTDIAEAEEFFNKAMAAFKQGDYQKAKSDFDECIGKFC